MYLVAARMLLTLIAPHSPLSVVTRTITARFPSRRTRNGWRYSVARSPTVCSTSTILSAYGRVAFTAACARRSRVAATTCIALVIFCVFLIESMRRTMSLNAGNYVAFFLAAVLAGVLAGALGAGLAPSSAVFWGDADDAPGSATFW